MCTSDWEPTTDATWYSTYNRVFLLVRCCEMQKITRQSKVHIDFERVLHVT